MKQGKDTRVFVFLLAFQAAAIGVVNANAANVVIASDDWIFTNTGFSACPDTANLAINLANYLTGGTSGIRGGKRGQMET